MKAQLKRWKLTLYCDAAFAGTLNALVEELRLCSWSLQKSMFCHCLKRTMLRRCDGGLMGLKCVVEWVRILSVFAVAIHREERGLVRLFLIMRSLYFLTYQTERWATPVFALMTILIMWGNSSALGGRGSHSIHLWIGDETSDWIQFCFARKSQITFLNLTLIYNNQGCV